MSVGLMKETMLFDRGMSQHDLWGLYAVSDCYFQTSKAEGLGLPVMDAMACGVPVVATDTGALHELLEDGRGILIEPSYEFGDVWLNSNRSMIDVEKAAQVLREISENGAEETKKKASTYIHSRTWEVPTRQLNEKILELNK